MEKKVKFETFEEMKNYGIENNIPPTDEQIAKCLRDLDELYLLFKNKIRKDKLNKLLKT